MLQWQARRTDCSDHSFESYTAEAVLALGMLAVIITPLRRRQPTTQRQDNVLSAILSAWSLLADKASKGASGGFVSLILLLLLWASSCHVRSQTSGLIGISRIEITHSITRNQFHRIHLIGWKIKGANVSQTALSLDHKLLFHLNSLTHFLQVQPLLKRDLPSHSSYDNSWGLGSDCRGETWQLSEALHHQWIWGQWQPEGRRDRQRIPYWCSLDAIHLSEKKNIQALGQKTE